MATKYPPKPGWIIDDGEGDYSLKIISETRRAAIVNWLVVEANLAIMNSFSDAVIEELWRDYRGDAKEVQVTVTVTPVEYPGCI